ncbi:pitrilysin family protein [Xanthomonadaceae bacterium JHOS43]|nr:pitrilysin family protein [Xanthomonadaceae bacterium JHOS43]
MNHSLIRTLTLAGLFGLSVAATAAPPAATAVPGSDAIVTHTLDNGLKVVIWPSHDIPNVALYTWFRVGGRNEYPGITGLAHYFEHMMFNGTSTLAPGEFDRVMEAAGGANNAYTSSDVTVYQDWFPKEALETILTLEADRMANLDFDPDVVESERGVVYSERRSSVDNEPFGVLYEQMQATAFVAHPYQFPVIGWPSDIENWSIEDLKTFYRTYYAPNNATMFVVGDVEPKALLARIEHHFGKIPRQPEPRAVTTKEPEQLGERRFVVEKEGVQAPILAMAWHAGSATDADQRPLQLLMSIMAGGESSRLYQRLVEREQIALDVGSIIDAGFDPGLVWFYALLPPGGDPAQVERVIGEELARLQKEGVTQAELGKAHKRAQAGFWRSLQTISGKAQALGTFDVFHGDYQQLFAEPAKVAAIEATSLIEVARRTFRDANRTVGHLRPAAPASTPASEN